MGVKIVLRQYEHVGAAMRRFKKQLERSGMLKELRKKEYYEKPSEARRRAKLRKKHNAQNPKPEKIYRDREY